MNFNEMLFGDAHYAETIGGSGGDEAQLPTMLPTTDETAMNQFAWTTTAMSDLIDGGDDYLRRGNDVTASSSSSLFAPETRRSGGGTCFDVDSLLAADGSVCHRRVVDQKRAEVGAATAEVR